MVNNGQGLHDIFSTVTDDDESSSTRNYLNHAALAEIRNQDELSFIRELPDNKVLDICTLVASRVLGLSSNQRVYFTRNTTEAYAIALDYLSIRSTSNTVALPEGNYTSIDRATSEYFNFGEKYNQTTYSTLEEPYYIPSKDTGNYIVRYDQTHKGIERVLVEEEPDIIVLTRTNRINGREMDINQSATLISAIANSISRKYKPSIITDSAQTLTTKTEFSVTSDFQVGCFHKGLGVFHPLGFGIVDDNTYQDLTHYLTLNGNDYFPSKNTFHSVPPIDGKTIPFGLGEVKMESFYCFLETLAYLSRKDLISGIDFSSPESLIHTTEVSFQNLIDYRKRLYKKAYLRLRDIPEVNITSDFPVISSGYILSFELSPMFPLSAAGLVANLRKVGIYITYISETNEVRISFGPDNTDSDVDQLVEEILQCL